MIILALESSCDETAAAVVRDGRVTLGECIASQAALHSRFGGVVPEIASRKHVEAVIPVLRQCLAEAGLGLGEIDAFAVTAGPGLVGALLVAVTAAKALASVCGKPLYAVHHIAGHIAANYIAHPDLEPPFVCLVASGGHSNLVHVRDYADLRILGRTRDDAAGEAFDKVARVLELGYPGGPAIDRCARAGDARRYHFPKPRVEGSPLDFSFSGLKTQALSQYQKARQEAARRGLALDEVFSRADFAASFQESVVEALSERCFAAAALTGCRKIALAGGVAANRALRARLRTRGAAEGFEVYCPEPRLCTDNAEMIAAAAYFQARAGVLPAGPGLNAQPAWKLENSCTETSNNA